MLKKPKLEKGNKGQTKNG